MRLLKSQIDFIKSTHRHTGFVAGFGAGKTEAAVAKVIIKKLEMPGIDVAYYLPTYNLISDIAVPRITAKLNELGLGYELRQSQKKIEVYNYGQSIGRIILRTMDNPELIVGYEVGYSLIDECDVLPKIKMTSVFNQIIARNRSKLPDGMTNQTDVVGTPEGFRWFYDFFVKNKSENKKLIRASTLDNHHLPEHYIDTLKDTYTEAQLNAYLHGEFVNLQSQSVYYAYDRDFNHSSREVQPNDILHIGMDFNIGNMTAIIHVIENGLKIAVAEIVKIYDTYEMCRVIRERFPNHQGVIYPDSSGKNRSTSGASDIEILKKETKMKLIYGSRNPFVRDRVNAVNGALFNSNGERTYLVNSHKCPTLSEALERQSYKGGEPDKSSGFDHACEAAGYFIVGSTVRRIEMKPSLG